MKNNINKTIKELDMYLNDINAIIYYVETLKDDYTTLVGCVEYIRDIDTDMKYAGKDESIDELEKEFVVKNKEANEAKIKFQQTLKTLSETLKEYTNNN